MSSLRHKDLTYQRIVEVLLRTRRVDELAAEIGTSRQAIHAWRTGSRPRPVHREWLIEKAVEMLERAGENGR